MYPVSRENTNWQPTTRYYVHTIFCKTEKLKRKINEHNYVDCK
jgi:hypothetical protein